MFKASHVDSSFTSEWLYRPPLYTFWNLFICLSLPADQKHYIISFSEIKFPTGGVQKSLHIFALWCVNFFFFFFTFSIFFLLLQLTQFRFDPLSHRACVCFEANYWESRACNPGRTIHCKACLPFLLRLLCSRETPAVDTVPSDARLNKSLSWCLFECLFIFFSFTNTAFVFLECSFLCQFFLFLCTSY